MLVDDAAQAREHAALAQQRGNRRKRRPSSSADKTVILWDLDVESLKTEACRTANRNLSCQEWRQHIGPEVPYRKTCEALPGPAEPCR